MNIAASPRALYFTDHTAGNFAPGIPGGLSVEIIGMTVDHHSSPNDIPDAKPVGQHRKVRPPIAAQQRRKIPRMPGMGGTPGIIVASGLREPGAITAAAFMDMQRKEPCLRIRKTENIRSHQDPLAMGVKFYCSVNC